MKARNLSSIIELVNNGKKYPAIGLVSERPDIAATISKLVEGRYKSNFTNKGKRNVTEIDGSAFETISQDIAEKSNDADSIMQLFPEMELAQQILISCIISPKDMSGTDIIITAPQGFTTTEVNATLVSAIREYFDHEYKIKDMLPDILSEILFKSGSLPIAVIPESSVDDIINGTTSVSTESLDKIANQKTGEPNHIGFLGNAEKSAKVKTAFEGFSSYTKEDTYDSKIIFKDKGIAHESFLTVVDNSDVLKFPALIKRNNQKRVSQLISKTTRRPSVGLEAKSSDMTDVQFQSMFYKNRKNKNEPMVKVPTKNQASRNFVGKPLIMRMPAESVIPVHVPGDEKNHIGYFFLIDEEGNPVSKNSSKNHFNDLQSRLNGNQTNPGGSNMSSFLLDKAKTGLAGNGAKINITNATKIYTDIVESDLIERLRNGIYQKNVSLGRNQEIYRIMFARTLANQMTRLLYMPAEMVTYFAYKYDSNGIGVSLMENMRILNSIRAMSMFTRVMASLKNSIGRTQVKLKFDPEDPDPTKTVEIAMHEVAKTRQQYFPLGINTPNDLVDWVQRSGYEYTFEGHPGLPDMGIEFEEKNSNYVKPDTELEDDLRKRSIMTLGMSPEMVDNGFNSEFATTAVNNSILMSKRVKKIQDHITPLLTEHARMVVGSDSNLVNHLRDIIGENYDKLDKIVQSEEELSGLNKDGIIEFILESFLNSFNIELPKPDSVSLENQMTAFETQSNGLDKALDSWINTDILNENVAGKLSGSVDNLKGIIKSYFMRRWMSENNVYTELAELTTKDETGSPILKIFDIQADHIEGLVRSAVKFVEETKGMANAADKDLDKITGGDGMADTPSSSDNGTGDSGEDDFGGMDDFEADTDAVDGTEDDLPTDDAEDDPTKPAKDLPKLDE